jgi:hypothetical protein
MKHGPSARQLGAAFGAFLRLAFIALFQHAASPSGATPKKTGRAFAERPVRLKKIYFGGLWRTFGGLRGLAGFGAGG